MAYNFPKDRVYSIKQAQKRLELSDDDLQRCLKNGWLRPALPKAVIYGAEHLAALLADQAGHLPAEPEEQADMFHPLPDYAYSVVEDGPRGHVVFEDLSGDTFFLVVVRRYSTTHSNDEEITAPGFYRQGKPDPNAEISVRVDPVTAWDLAQAICGEEYGFDPEEIIGGHLVVTEEEVERFTNEYETAFTEETKKESDAKSHERLNEQAPPEPNGLPITPEANDLQPAVPDYAASKEAMAIYARMNAEQRKTKWQEWANEIGNELAAENKTRTKEAVAYELKLRYPEVQQSIDTVKRDISKQWR